MAPRKLHDRYFKQAKAEGYLARSAYKLLEINDRYRVLRAGPGCWTSAALPVRGCR
ncbi:MAG: hypothetical protein IPJ41_06230 [Phycisphaerales bacterium]|nr:hypothetical protein [Phycisphaerales bacterium]